MLGFACRVLDKDKQPSAVYKYCTQTLSAFRNSGYQADPVRKLISHNLKTLEQIIVRLSTVHPNKRMYRIPDDMFLFLDLPEASHIYNDKAWMEEISHNLCGLGRLAMMHDVRLSIHPAQFIVPNSKNPVVREKSIRYLESWARIAQTMGYKGQGKDGFCINIHLGSGYDSTQELIKSWTSLKLSNVLRNLLTIENNDSRWTLKDLIYTCEAVDVRPVFDMHHHWCVTGKWLTADLVYKHVKEQWHDLRPKIHFSLPKPDVFKNCMQANDFGMPIKTPDLKSIKSHSDDFWFEASLQYLATYTKNFDVMIELKNKNWAVRQAHDWLKANNYATSIV